MSRLQEFFNQYPDEMEDLCGYLINYDFTIDNNGNFIMKTKRRNDSKIAVFIDGRMTYDSFEDFVEDLTSEVNYVKEETEDIVDMLKEYKYEDYHKPVRTRKQINYAPTDDLD